MAKVPSGRPAIPASATERPLVVRLLKEPQPVAPFWSRRLRLALLVATIIVGIYGYLASMYHLPERAPLLSFEDAPITVHARLRYPEFASVGDASYIEVTAINTGTSPISGTLVIVLDSGYPLGLLPGNRADLALVNLPPGDQMSHRLEFRPVGPWGLPVNDSFSFHLLLLAPGGEKYESEKVDIGLMPLPHQSWALTGLRGGFIASLAALFWERIKKWLFP